METGVRARSSQQRQQAILESALDLLLEKGFGATTLDEILELSGASVGSFYHHFKSKLDVAAALYLTILESYQRAFVAELRKHNDARAGIEGGVRHHLRWVASTPKAAAYLTHCREPEVAEASEARVQELNRTFFKQVIGWLTTHISAKTIKSLPVELYHPLWIGPADEFARYWLAASRSHNQLLRAERVLAPAAWEALRLESTVHPKASAVRAESVIDQRSP